MFYWYIYRIPLVLVFPIMIFVSLIYRNFMGKIKHKHAVFSRILNYILLVLSILGIVYITVINREKEDYEICLIPFKTLIISGFNKEIIRDMVMNVLLFFPFGLTLSYVFKKQVGKTVLYVVLCGLLLSLLVEIIQFVFSVGVCETDDVICNSLGALCGSIPIRNSESGIRNYRFK